MLLQGMIICLPTTLLNQPSEIVTIKQDSINEKTTTKNDSPKNWYTSCLRIDPIVLRIPTSLALFSDRAVLRFTKFMQARSKTKIPIKLTIHTMRTGLGSVFPSLVTG